MSYYEGFRSHIFFVNEELAMIIAKFSPRRDVLLTFPEGCGLRWAGRELFSRRVMRELVANNAKALEALPEYSEICMWDAEDNPPTKSLVYIKIDGVWELDDRTPFSDDHWH